MGLRGMKIRVGSNPVPALLLAAGLSGAVDARAAVLEEIVVTATKRGNVLVQETVGSIRARTGDFLKDHDLRTFEDVARMEPSLQFSRSSIGDLQPIIRGVQSPGAGTVGVYFDETVITGVNFQEQGGRTPDVGAYDIDRVEILKGPQGTLFGASSLTGTVRFISNKPDATGFDANLRFGGHALKDGDGGFNVDGMFNIPLLENVLAIRGVGWHESRGGFIDQFAGLNAVTTIRNADESDKTGGRIMARFTPNDRLTVDAFYMRQDLDVSGPSGFCPTLDECGVGRPITIIQGAPFLIGQVAPALTAFAGERVITSPSRAGSKSDIELYGFTAEYDFRFGTGNISVSNYEPEFFRVEGTTAIATLFGLVDVPTFFATGIPQVSTPFAKIINQDREVFTIEARFSSELDGPFNFVTGVFYQDDERESEFMVLRTDPVTGAAPCTRHPQCIRDPDSAAARSIVTGNVITEDTNTFAVFANFEYQLADAWTLGGGLRFFDFDEDDLSLLLQAFQGSIPFTVPPAFGGPVQTTPTVDFEGSFSESEVTWTSSLGYQHTENQLYYVKAETGFRQGGINKNVSSAEQLGVIIPKDFGSDEVLSLEAGAKTSWFDDRLVINLAYFKMFWDDMQVFGQEASSTVEFLTNAAESEIDGVEVELFARPTDHWLFTFGATWLDARLTQDQNLGFDPDEVGLVDPVIGRDGDRIPKVPEWAFSGTAEYTVPFQFMDNVEMALRANYSYTGQSRRFFNNSFENNTRIGDYFLLNLSADFTYENWVLRLFANNVTDKVARIDIFGESADPQQVVTSEPRAIGAQLQWFFR